MKRGGGGGGGGKGGGGGGGEGEAFSQPFSGSLPFSVLSLLGKNLLLFLRVNFI